MDDHARRLSDELRHKHIRTLEVVRQLIDENNAMRNKLELAASDKVVVEGEGLPEGETASLKELEAQLARAEVETAKARAAEEANELNLTVLQGRNKELERTLAAAERKSQEQVEHFESDIAKLKEQLASAIAEARGAQAKAELDVSRLESEVEELRLKGSEAALNRVGTAWTEDGDDDESVLSNREVEDLRVSVRTALRRESNAKRRCAEFARQAKSEALRREAAERQLQALQTLQAARPTTTSTPSWRGPHFELTPCQRMPSPPVTYRHGLLNGADVTRTGRGGTPAALVKFSPEATSEPAAEPLPVCVLPRTRRWSSISDDGSAASLGGASRTKTAKNAEADDEENLGSGIRRLRASEKILLESNAKLQRELKQNSKRLEKAERFASDLEAELQKVAGNGVTFEGFVALRRDKQALRKQLAEIKQAFSMVLASSRSGKAKISPSDQALLDPLMKTGSTYSRRIASSQRPPSSKSQQHQDGNQHSIPRVKTPTQRRVSSLLPASAPFRAVSLYQRAGSMGALDSDQQ